MQLHVGGLQAVSGHREQFAAHSDEPDQRQNCVGQPPLDLRDWFAPGVLANWVEEAIEKLAAAQNAAETVEIGTLDCRGRTILALLCFSYAMGIFDSGKIASDSSTNTPLRLLAGNLLPARNELRRFRRRHRPLLIELLFELFVRTTLEKCGDRGMSAGLELHGHLLEAASQRLDIAIQMDLTD